MYKRQRTHRAPALAARADGRTHSEVRRVIPPIASGIVPVSELLLSESAPSRVSAPSVVGMAPTSRLSERRSVSSLLQPLRLDGSAPPSRLAAKSSTRSRLAPPMAAGSAPEMMLLLAVLRGARARCVRTQAYLPAHRAHGGGGWESMGARAGALARTRFAGGRAGQSPTAQTRPAGSRRAPCARGTRCARGRASGRGGRPHGAPVARSRVGQRKGTAPHMSVRPTRRPISEGMAPAIWLARRLLLAVTASRAARRAVESRV